MCGIAGIIDFRGRRIDRGLLERFCADLAHRGPDDHGIWISEQNSFSVGLAHRRLSVIDPTPDGHQPMVDPQGRRALTYNGELYNYEPLGRSIDPGVSWRTRCDTEVFLKACSLWGSAALSKFDGMWAAGFVDIEKRVGHLSRDPYGIKPLYYSIQNDRLAFASEIKALRRALDASPEIDPQAVSIFLQLGFIPHPLTIYKNVHKLAPGHILSFDANGCQAPRRYDFIRPGHDAESDKPHHVTSTGYDEACRNVRRLVSEAVQAQCIADVPLGAFLSGGLDSSIVTSCLAQSSSQPVKTFSIGYADHPRYDETSYARLVAERFHTDHHEFRLTFRDVLDSIEPALNQLGEPFADSSLLPTMLVSRETRKHVTVALSGDGGDELFGGYWRYLAHGYLEKYSRLPSVLRHGIIEPLLSHAPSARSNRLLDRLRQAQTDSGFARTRRDASTLVLGGKLTDADAVSLMGAERATASRDQIANMYMSAADDLLRSSPHFSSNASVVLNKTDLNAVLLADLAVSLPADMLFKVDIASMMHSLEVRVPLLSPSVVNYVAPLELEHKIGGGTGKRVLRDAFRDVLPAEVLERRKMGFEAPVGEFLRNELREMYTSIVTPACLARFGIDAVAANSLYDEHLTRREDRTELLWSLLVLCHWAESNP